MQKSQRHGIVIPVPLSVQMDPLGFHGAGTRPEMYHVSPRNASLLKGKVSSNSRARIDGPVRGISHGPTMGPYLLQRIWTIGLHFEGGLQWRFECFDKDVQFPKGPCAAHLRTLVPKTIAGMAFGTRVLKWAAMDPLGLERNTRRDQRILKAPLLHVTLFGSSYAIRKYKA